MRESDADLEMQLVE